MEKDVSVSVRTTTTTIPLPAASASASAAPPTVTMAAPTMAQAQTAALQEARSAVAKFPLSFIPNQGQFEKGVEFEARGSGYITSLTADAAYIGLHSRPTGAAPVKQSLVRLGLQGANPMRFEPSEKQTSYANYIGGPASRWQSHVPNYGRVTAAEVYRGIDASFYGNQSNLEFDFVVKPGADPKAIRLQFDGGQVKLDENGDIAVATELGTVYQRKPVLYQEINGARKPVEGSYKLDGNLATIQVGAYDPSRTLIIDPRINFSIVISGVGDTTLNAVDQDKGAVYVAGTTSANTLALTSPTISSSRAASSQTDAIVISYTKDGQTVNWYTFFGGSAQDSGNGIAVEDPTANAPGATPPNNNQFAVYVVGQTYSPDLAKNDPAANTYQGGGDGFVVRLNGDGTASAGPVYIGGPNADSATSVAVRCANGGCSTHITQDHVYIGMSVQSAIATPTGLVVQNAFGGEPQAGAVVELRATDLTVAATKGNVFYVNGTGSAGVTALALLPFAVQGPIASPALQEADQVVAVGNVSAPGGLTPLTNTVQGGHASTAGCPGAGANDGFGGGAADGFYAIFNTEHGTGPGTRSFSHVYNLDYIGGCGNDNVKGVAALPDGNIVIVGDTDAMPFTTPGVISGANSGLYKPVQNYSCGTTPNGTAAACGSRNVVAAIINPGATGATATAQAGTKATATYTVGQAATLTTSLGTPAAVQPAAAGALAQSTVTLGTPATVTATVGTQGTLTLTAGTQATGLIATGALPSGDFAVTGVTLTNAGGSGYWNTVPSVTINVPAGDSCAVAPTAVANLTAPPPQPPTQPNGSIYSVTITNSGDCTGPNPLTVTFGLPGIQSLATNVAGSGYQSTAAPNAPSTVPVTFTGVSCTGAAPVATVTLTNGIPVATVYPGNTAAAGGTNASLSNTVNVTNFGSGCTFTAPAATVPAPGLSSLVIAGGTGYQGGSTVTAAIATANGCSGITASFTVQNNGTPNQTLLLDNILTNSGIGCTNPATPPTFTLTNPGVTSVGLAAVPNAGGTGYNTAHMPLIVFNGTCDTPPAATVTINNVAGNITGETLTNSGTNCTGVTTETIDFPGITNINVLTPPSGTNYPPNTTIPITIAAPGGPTGNGASAGQTVGPHCSATATGYVNTNANGQVTSAVVTDEGCGYNSNPTVTLPGPGLTVNVTNGGSAYQGPLTATLGNTAGNCTSAPASINISGNEINAAGTIQNNIPVIPANCLGPGAPTLTVTPTPGVLAITPGTAGDSYNIAPLVTFNCTTQPSVTVGLAGAAPSGATIAAAPTSPNFGQNCTAGNATVSAPGLSSPNPPLAAPFTVTNPGLGYTSAPTVMVNGCSTARYAAPAATAVLGTPPANPTSVAGITLNSATSGGDNCVNPTVTLTSTNLPSFVALDYLGGQGGVVPGMPPMSGNTPDPVVFSAQAACAAAGCSYANGVATDASGNIYIAGQTFSPNFPVLYNNLWNGSTSFKGTSDGFVSRISEVGGTVQGVNGGGFSAYNGGTSDDSLNGIASDYLFNIFAAGQTWSSDFPVLPPGTTFSGTSDGTLTNIFFNNMIVAPSSMTSFTETFQGALPAGQNFTVTFNNGPGTFSVPAAGVPCTTTPSNNVCYSANSGNTTWLSITQSAGGFSLAVNTSNLTPDHYSATFLISSTTADTPSITFTVNLTVTSSFVTYNCPSAGCTAGATPSSAFAFTYSKAEASASTVTPTQYMVVQLQGVLPNSNNTVYPGTGYPGGAAVFAAQVNYNTNNAFVSPCEAAGTYPPTLSNPCQNGAFTGANPVLATNANFKWFNVGTTQQDCSGTACNLPLGTPLPISIYPQILDLLSQSGSNASMTAQGNITISQVLPTPNGMGGTLAQTVVTITATVTPRLVFSSSAYPPGTTPPAVVYGFACTNTVGACNSPNPAITNHLQMRGDNDVIRIVGLGNKANASGTSLAAALSNAKISGLYITSAPPGGNANCFTVDVPAGVYLAPSSSDPTSVDLSLPVAINLAGTGAPGTCIQGVYTGNIVISGTQLGAGDSVTTLTAGYNTLGPDDSPVALTSVTQLSIPVTISLGNELYYTANGFNGTFDFGGYVINSQEGLATSNPNYVQPIGGGTPIALPANQVGTVQLSLPPNTYSTQYQVQCVANGNGATGYPGTAPPASSSAVTCDWFTAAITGGGTLSNGTPTATLTIGLVSQGGTNITNLPTAGGAAGNEYTGTLQLIYTGGTAAGNSLVYPVQINVSRQPLNWSKTAGGTPTPVTLPAVTVGSGISTTSAACGTVYSTLAEYIANGNPVPVKLNVGLLANQTFAAINGTGGNGATVNTGWLSVAQSGSANTGADAGHPGDAFTCTTNATNLAPGTYTACIDAVSSENPGPTPPFNANATSCATAWEWTANGPSVGRTVETVTWTVNALPTLSTTPTSLNFAFQQGTGGNSGFQPAPYTQNGVTLTLTDANPTSQIQGITVTSSVPWMTISAFNPALGPNSSLGGASPNPSSTTFTVNITPPANPGPYNGSILIACTSCSLNPSSIPVTLNVIAQPTITTVPGTLTNFTFTQQGSTPATQNLVVNLTSGTGNVIMTPSSCNTAGATCTGGSWLQVNGAATATASQPISTSGVQFSIGVDPNQLNSLAASNTPYNGSVSISVPGATNTPVVLNVSVTVIPQSTLVSTPSGTSFSLTVGGSVTPATQGLTVATTTTSGQSSTAGFTLTPSSQSNWLWINGAGAAVSNTATSSPLNYTISVNPSALATLEASVPAGSSQVFTGSIAVTTTTPPAGSVTPSTINYTLTISTQPIINISNCSGASFAYTLTTAAPTPASITCTVSDSSTVVGINTLAVVGCPASWETCTLGATTLAAGGSTTLTLTPSNLANQNPGTFGPPSITITGASAGPSGGNAITGNVPGVSITNTPLTTLSSSALTFGPYTQGNLATPQNQTVTGTLAEGNGGTPAGPGTPGTGTLTSAVASSSFATGACTGGVTAPPNWLAVTQTSTGSGSAAQYSFIVAVNPAVFPTLSAATTCTGTINVTSTGVNPAAAQKTIGVSFTINPQSGFTVSTAAGTITSGGNFTSQYTIVNGYPVSLTSTAAPVPVTVSSAPTQGQQYTVTIQPVTGGNWLVASACTVASPCTASANTAGFTLGVNPAANTLTGGQPYFATVSVASANSSSSPNNTVTFTVQLNVDATPSLSVTGTPALVGGAFGLGTHFQLFTVPGSQVLNVATASSSAGAPATPAQFTVTNTNNAGTPAGLLVIGGTQPFTTTGTATTTPVTISYSAAVANAATPGTYGGIVTVQVTQTGVTTVPQSIQVPWSITIDAPAAIQTTPTAAQGVIINCQFGSTCNATIGVSATSTGQNVNIPVNATVTSLPTPWLQITSAPTTANSTSISVSAATTGLQANTSYAGQIVITSADASNSPYTVPVTLNVTLPGCAFSGPGTISLTSAGTTTGGFLPETAGTVAFTNTSSCGTYTVTSNSPWLIATGGTGVTYIAEVNPHSISRSGTLTITNANSASGYPAQVVTVTESGNTASLTGRQIDALYQSILGRDPDQGGYNFWLGLSGTGLGQMADYFLTSPESFESNFAVMAAYQAADGTVPTYAQFVSGVNSLRGGQTITALFNSLMATTPGYSATNLYQNLLNRQPTSAETTACTSAGLAACFGTITGLAPAPTVIPVSVAANEFQSTCGSSACTGVGGTTHAATGDHTNGLYIAELYYVILGRDYDQGGFNFWVNTANGLGAGLLFSGNAGQANRLQILGNGTPNEGFIGSPEFQGLYQP